jgi:hypothetical protein
MNIYDNIIQNDKYIISYSDNIVEAWSVQNIPFEPKDWQKEMRTDLRCSLEKIAPISSLGMYEKYAVENNAYCDVENVLLYNIGTGVFRNICNSILCLEREFSSILPPIQVKNIMPHYYRYELISNANLKVYSPKITLAEWAGLECDKFDEKPSFYWNYIKNSLLDIQHKDFNDKFGIEIKITAPRMINLTSIIKPLLDGVICAFHCHDRNTDDDILNALFSQTGISKAALENMLLDDNFNVLGKRNLIWKRGDGIQWSPADDLCVAIKLMLDVNPSNGWGIDGKIFSI